MLVTGMLLMLANMSIEPIITVYVATIVPDETRVTIVAGLAMSAAALGSILSASRLGKLADRLGHLRVIVGCLLVSAMLLIPQAFVTAGWQLVGLRLLMGLSLGGLLPCVATVIRHNVPERSAGSILGYSTSSQYVGQVVGPLAGGLTLRQIGARDRLRELDFEIPLAGGDVRGAVPDVSVFDLGELLRTYLPADDPLISYADRLMSASLGGQSLRGYLSGSIDAVLRLPDQRYLVVDYKTNYLGDSAADYTAPRLAEAMLHSDYPLQALLYTVVLHRFLRWRQPSYNPAAHLAGVQYLFVRGMCGADTPGSGVFSWQPPADLVVAVSDLLDEGSQAA